MGISGPAPVHHRRHLVVLCALIAVTALGLGAATLWGPPGSRYTGGSVDSEESAMAWADEAVHAWQQEMCRDPEQAVSTWLHPSMVEAVSAAWLEGSSPRDCDDDSDSARLRAVSATRLDDDQQGGFGDGGLPGLTDADAVWAVRFAGSRGASTNGTWWVVVEGGRAYLYSPYLLFYAECANGAHEC